MAYLVLIDRCINFFNGGHGMKKTGFFLAAITAGAVALSVSSLFAASSTSPQNANFNVNASVAKRCTITTPPADFNFGNYDPTAATPLDAAVTSAFTIRCTKNTTATITIAQPPMAAAGSPDNLVYALFTDASRTNNWTTGSVYVSTSAATNSVHDIYGRINAGQDVATPTDPTNYTAIATLTVAY
jgi:spore coat protein U-like protein